MLGEKCPQGGAMVLLLTAGTSSTTPTAQHWPRWALGHQDIRAVNETSRTFTVPGKGPYYLGLLKGPTSGTSTFTKESIKTLCEQEFKYGMHVDVKLGRLSAKTIP